MTTGASKEQIRKAVDKELASYMRSWPTHDPVKIRESLEMIVESYAEYLVDENHRIVSVKDLEMMLNKEELTSSERNDLNDRIERMINGTHTTENT